MILTYEQALKRIEILGHEARIDKALGGKTPQGAAQIRERKLRPALNAINVRSHHV